MPKRTNMQERQEIIVDHINTVNQYSDDAVMLLVYRMLGSTTGVIHGMTVTSPSSGAISVAAGSIYTMASGGVVTTYCGYIGELEAASGVTMSIPVSGTRTDTIAAYYELVEDTPGTGYILADVTTRQESVENILTRKLGAAKIQVFENTLYTALTSSYVPLAEVSMSTAGVGTITAIMPSARPTRIDNSLEFDAIVYSMMF